MDRRKWVSDGPQEQTEWLVKQHGADDKNREGIGLRRNDQNGQYLVFMHLFYISADRKGLLGAARRKGNRQHARRLTNQGVVTFSSVLLCLWLLRGLHDHWC